MPKWINRIRNMGWRRWLLVLAVLALISISAANEITRRVAATYLGAVVDGNAAIAKVRIGFQKLRVEQLQVWSAGCGEPLVSVDNVSAELSLWNGIRNGIWLGKIVVDRPIVQVHFDVQGILLTNLPTIPDKKTESTPITTLPFRSLEIRDARFVVHQEGRNPLDVDDMTLSVRAEDQQVKITGDVPRLLRGRCAVQSIIDIATLEANSDFRYKGLATTSEELAKLPLVPPAVNAQPWSASTSFAMQQSGSIVDLREVNLALQLHDAVSINERRRGRRASQRRGNHQ